MGQLSTALVRAVVHRIALLRKVLNFSPQRIFDILKNAAPKLLSNPHVAEMLRFVFLGTVVEATRVVSTKVMDWVRHFFIVKASFTRGDFAYDWVSRYLEDRDVWGKSRVFSVGVQDPRYSKKIEGAPEGSGKPEPKYQPAPSSPEFFRWRNHWIMANMSESKGSDGHAETLTLSVWSRNRKILDEFVLEARQHYFDSPIPPRQVYLLPDTSGSLVTVRFKGGDLSFEWMLQWVRAHHALDGVVDFEATTKPSDLPSVNDGASDGSFMALKPNHGAKQLIRWKDHWFQFDVDIGERDYHNQKYHGSINVTVHNSNRQVLLDLVAEAREEYNKVSMSQVNVHLCDPYGSWTRCVRKSRRALNTLMLPDGMKEMLLDDIREFLDSEQWYHWAGVPHRRGYLLYGEPGTGKSTTIHALASELGLEVYYIQLATQGMNDHSLARLISETPTRCILLLEDIDCAIPSRDDDDDEDDPFGNNRYEQRVSDVTLSGLLNALDSVASEEGRITFATTNHIEKLDPALIREGRMDVKIEYKLATREQIYNTFLRFYESSSNSPPAIKPSSSRFAPIELDDDKDYDVHAFAEQFAEVVPDSTFSLAQLQGFMLTRKNDPRRAVTGVGEWIKAKMDEKRMLDEKKAKKRAKARMERLAEIRARMEEEAAIEEEEQRQREQENQKLLDVEEKGEDGDTSVTTSAEGIDSAKESVVGEIVEIEVVG